MHRLLAQQQDSFPEDVVAEDLPRHIDSYGWWTWWPSGPVWLVGVAFLAWMLIECVRRDPERNLWLWIILFVNPGVPLGALVYFVVRLLPQHKFGQWQALRPWTGAGEIHRLEAAARQIGNAHQHTQLGDALRETGSYRRAGEAYAAALGKDAGHLPAIWGAALVDVRLNELASARTRLEQILAVDPGYKFGDVSLAYGRVLSRLHDTPAARNHLEGHLKRWKQPEAVCLLAQVLIEQNESFRARALLESMLIDLRGSPAFFVRQNRAWRFQAGRLLARLPRT